jgi:hypothetical protein
LDGGVNVWRVGLSLGDQVALRRQPQSYRLHVSTYPDAGESSRALDDVDELLMDETGENYNAYQRWRNRPVQVMRV